MEWIDIKIELPNNKNNLGDSYNCVLVFSSFNRAVAFAQYIEGNWDLLSGGIFSDVGDIGFYVDKITHWMPIPRYPIYNQPERSKRENHE